MASELSSLRLAGIEEESITDGPGLRFVVFTQGCPHACKGCHNPQTHNPNGGKIYTLASVVQLYQQNPLLEGITFSGGEPFCQAEALSLLAQEIKTLGGTVVTYTGYTFENLLAQTNKGQNKTWLDLLDLTDLLIDGPYIEQLRDLDLTFRGSANQRLLDRNARRAIADALRKKANF